MRIWPGIYVNAAEEWTEGGVTFGCIANFGAMAKVPRRDESGSDGGGFVKVKALHSIVLPGGGADSLVVCDLEGARLSRRMDEAKPWDPTSAGECFPGTKTLDHRETDPPLPPPAHSFDEAH